MKEDQSTPSLQFADPTREMVVITTVSPWHEPPRIRHQVAKYLSKHFNVLYVQTFVRQFAPPKKITDTLIVVTVGRLIRGLDRIGLYAPGLVSIYRRNVANTVLELAKKYSFTCRGIVNFNFNFPEIFEVDFPGKKIYLCNDEFVNRNTFSFIRKKRYTDLEQRLATRATNVLAVSYPLANRLIEFNKNTEVFLPGVDFSFVDSAIEQPKEKKSGEKINVAFMGYINNRLDLEWLVQLALTNEFKIRLIGKIESAELHGRLSKFHGVIFDGPFYGTALIESLAEADVLIIPYDTSLGYLTAVTAAPNKLFIYLASGRPVVISNMTNFISLPDGFLYKASSAQDFISQIKNAALLDTVELRKARVEFARKNSWEERIKILLQHLE